MLSMNVMERWHCTHTCQLVTPRSSSTLDQALMNAVSEHYHSIENLLLVQLVLSTVGNMNTNLYQSTRCQWLDCIASCNSMGSSQLNSWTTLFEAWSHLQNGWQRLHCIAQPFLNTYQSDFERLNILQCLVESQKWVPFEQKQTFKTFMGKLCFTWHSNRGKEMTLLFWNACQVLWMYQLQVQRTKQLCTLLCIVVHLKQSFLLCLAVPRALWLPTCKMVWVIHHCMMPWSYRIWMLLWGRTLSLQWCPGSPTSFSFGYSCLC